MLYYMMYMDTWMVVFCMVAALLGLVAWALGDGALLMVGGQFIAKCPKATYWRSVGEATLAALVSDAIIALASALSSFRFGSLEYVGVLAGAAAVGLLVTWLIIKAMFGVSFGRAILAWLPTLPLAVFALPAAGMLEAVLVPMVWTARVQADRTACMSNLRTIGSAAMLYKAENNKWPADLTALPAESVGSTKAFVCPCVLGSGSGNRPAGRTCDYFYCPPPSNAAPQTIIACDFGGNHGAGEESRNVLCADGGVRAMSEAEFRAALADPANAAFFTALSQVEVWVRYPPPGGN